MNTKNLVIVLLSLPSLISCSSSSNPTANTSESSASSKGSNITGSLRKFEAIEAEVPANTKSKTRRVVSSKMNMTKPKNAVSPPVAPRKRALESDIVQEVTSEPVVSEKVKKVEPEEEKSASDKGEVPLSEESLAEIKARFEQLIRTGSIDSFREAVLVAKAETPGIFKFKFFDELSIIGFIWKHKSENPSDSDASEKLRILIIENLYPMNMKSWASLISFAVISKDYQALASLHESIRANLISLITRDFCLEDLSLILQAKIVDDEPKSDKIEKKEDGPIIFPEYHEVFDKLIRLHFQNHQDQKTLNKIKVFLDCKVIFTTLTDNSSVLDSAIRANDVKLVEKLLLNPAFKNLVKPSTLGKSVENVDILDLVLAVLIENGF